MVKVLGVGKRHDLDPIPSEAMRGADLQACEIVLPLIAKNR